MAIDSSRNSPEKNRWSIRYLIFFSITMMALISCFSLRKSHVPVKAPDIIEKPSFWDIQRKGANFFNELELPERFNDGAKFGLEWIRLTPSKWRSAMPNAKKGDFLIGSREHYVGLVKEDVTYLRKMLDSAHAAGLSVVLTFLDLPYHYWSQHNGGTQDRRLWQDKKYWPSATQFLVDVARAFKGHPALKGYDLLNEPSPEKTGVQLPEWTIEAYQDWHSKIAESAQDLNAFYAHVIKEIRKVDPLMPIIIETGYYGTPWALSVLKPVDDPNVLYSFHMYEPFSFTFAHRNKQRTYEYPGTAPFGESHAKEQHWDKAALREFLKPVADWQQKFAIASNRIIVGEFGVNRLAKGAPRYFADLIELFDEFSWHWAFYSFREDSWQIMDYELGQKKPTWQYWQALEKQQIPKYPDAKNPFIDAIQNSMSTLEKRTKSQ